MDSVIPELAPVDSRAARVRKWVVQGVLAVGVLGAAGYTGVQAYNKVGPGSTPGAPEVGSVAAVTRGTVTTSVSTTGSVSFATRQVVTFGTAGTVASVGVAAGQQVQSGDVLAKLDDAAVAGLKRQVANDRISVTNAETALANAQAPVTDLQLSKQTEAVLQAQVALENAQKALDDLTAATADTAVPQRAIDSATLELQAAKQSLGDITDPSAGTIAALQHAVDIADLGLQQALRDLAALGPSQATASANAQEAVADDETAYGTPFMKYLGMSLNADQLKMDPSALLAAVGIDLSDIYDPNKQATLRQALEDQKAGKELEWDPTKVWATFALTPPGFASARPTPATVTAALEAAWNTLSTARTARDNLTLTQPAATAAAQAKVDQAQAALDKAKDNLAVASVPSDPTKAPLARQQTVLAAQAKVDQAQTNLDKAKDNLAAAVAGPSASAVALKRQQVVTGELNLADAKAALETLKATEPDPNLVEARKQDLAIAKATLANDLARLDQTVVKAPFAGYVSDVGAVAGNNIGANATVATVVDQSKAQVVANMSEADVARIRVGLPVTLTFDAYRGQQFAGTVTDIAATGRTTQGVVTYPVTITLASTTGMKEGLTATARIILSQASAVLVVPSRAVSGNSVQVLVDGVPTKRTVALGATDGTNTQVLSGLETGELVVIPGAASRTATTTNTQAQAFGAGPLGGGPGVAAGGLSGQDLRQLFGAGGGAAGGAGGGGRGGN